MNTERIKEIHDKTAYPDSRSVQQALLRVWNETEQPLQNRINELEEKIKNIHNTSQEVRSQRAFPVELLKEIDTLAESL